MLLKEFGGHPNIITLHNICKAHNNKDIYLVFEYMDTDLHNVIKQGNILNDLHKRFIMYQLFKATKYIHSGNVIHRDQKPSNILLNSRCHCKVADFGLARSVSSPMKSFGDSSDPALTDYVATRWYRAPEILVSSKRYTKGIDMWSLGCILAEMLLGQPLFPGTSTINQLEKIMSTIPPPTPEEVESVSAGYGSSLLRRAPAGSRHALPNLLKDASLDAVDLVSKLLVFDPNKRLTAVEALVHPYVQRFHKEANEPSMGGDVVLPLQDDVQLSVEEYRKKLYETMTSSSFCSQKPSKPVPEKVVCRCGSSVAPCHSQHSCALEVRSRHTLQPPSNLSYVSVHHARGQMPQRMTNHVWEVMRHKGRKSDSRLEHSQHHQLKPRQTGQLRPVEERFFKPPAAVASKQFNSYNHHYGTVTQSALLELRYSCN